MSYKDKAKQKEVYGPIPNAWRQKQAQKRALEAKKRAFQELLQLIDDEPDMDIPSIEPFKI